eukprot:gene24300-54004_t
MPPPITAHIGAMRRQPPACRTVVPVVLAARLAAAAAPSTL